MNTHPNTPFGIWLYNHDLWHPKYYDTINSIYHNLSSEEQKAIQTASGWIAIINSNVAKTPDEVFDIIQFKFPSITKETITGMLNKLNATLLNVSTESPYETAMSLIQLYFTTHTGNAWKVLSRTAVLIIADLFMSGTTPIQKFEMVLELVFQNIVKLLL